MDANIEYWKRVISKCGETGKRRLRGYLCSLTLGRDFGETVDDYYRRTNKTEFVSWAEDILT